MKVGTSLRKRLVPLGIMGTQRSASPQTSMVLIILMMFEGFQGNNNEGQGIAVSRHNEGPEKGPPLIPSIQ